MYGASGIPELIPPSGPPRQPGPAGQYNPGHPQVNGHDSGANPQRLGQRAPKLGQIGRSKKGECTVLFGASAVCTFKLSLVLNKLWEFYNNNMTMILGK